MANIVAGSLVYNFDIQGEQKLDSALAKGKRGLDDFGGSADQTGQRTRSTFAEIARGTLAVVGIGSALDVAKNVTVGAVSAFGDFESGLGLLRSVTQATDAQMQQFRTTAVALGKDVTLPGISAADAAAAMTELGKAGLSVNDTLSASKGVLQAAKAGNISVADSAKIVSSALLAFNLNGTHASRVADLFAGAANASNAEILDLGLGLQQTSASANSLQVPIEQTIAALAGMANAGIQASDAGTSLKTFFSALTPNSAAAKTAMDKLGISFFDADGKFVGMRKTIELLENSTKGMTQQQKQLTIETIFGSDASRAALVLANQGVTGFDKMTASITRQGIAAEVAAARNTGIKGSLEALKSNLETAALGFGEFISKGLKPLIDIANANLPVALAAVGGAIIGIGTAGLIAAVGIGAIGAAIVAVASIAGIGLLVGGIVAGIALLEQRFDFLGKIIDKLEPIFTGARIALRLVFDTLRGADPTLKASESAFGGLARLLSRLSGPLEAVRVGFRVVLDVIRGADPTLKATEGRFAGFARVAAGVADFIRDNFATTISSLKSIFSQTADALSPFVAAIREFVEKHSALFTGALKAMAIVAAVITFGPMVVAIGALLVALKVVSSALSFVADHFDAFKKIVIGIGLVVFSPLIGAIGLVIGTFKVLQSIFNLLGAAFGVAAQAVSTVWNTVLFPVFSVLFTVLKTLGEIWFKTWAFIALVTLGTLSVIIGFIWNNFLSPLLSGVTQVFAQIASYIGAVVATVGDILFVGFGLARQYIIQPIGQAIGFVVGAFAQILATITGFLGPIVGAVASGFARVYSAVAGPIGNVVSAVANGIGRVVDLFAGVGGRIVNALGNLGGTLFNVGRDMIQGLIDGAGSLLRDIGRFMANKLPSALRDPFKKALGIASPSKVFAGYGQNIVEGLVQGIGQGQGALGQALGGLSSQVTLGGSLTSGTTIASGQQIVGTMANQASSSAGTQVTINLDVKGVYARSQGDLREVAKQMLESVNEELRSRRLPELGNGAIRP